MQEVASWVQEGGSALVDPSSSFIFMYSKGYELGTGCMGCVEEDSTSTLGDALGG